MFEAKLDQMFVVSVISNTPRFRRRWHLFEQFARRVKESGIDHIFVELALGHRHFMLPPSPNVLHIRTIEEFWHKENLINLGIGHGRRLWPNKQMVAWVDADCAPVGRSFNDWWKETWHELQHYEFVQMWQWLQPLDIDHNPLGTPNPSFMQNYLKWGTPYPEPGTDGYPRQWGSPGLAWAANISALDQIGNIPDVAVCGAGDWYLAHMLISDLPFPHMSRYSPGYLSYWQNRQNLCEKWIKRDVGVVKGLYTHFFHGKTVNRGYNTRENILIDNQFDPNTDLKKDHHGLYQLETWEPRQIKMRDQLRQYFRQRNEDSIDSV